MLGRISTSGRRRRVPDYTNVGTVGAGGTVSVPIRFNDHFYIYEVQQITIGYAGGGASDSPNGGITKNGVPYSGASPLLPGITPTGLSQTWGNPPPLFMETRDDVECIVTQGTAGATVTVYAQYIRHHNNDPDYQEMKSTG